MNPNYDYAELELDMLVFDEPNMSYEYNTLCFWATKDGRIYSASDSGCSCPIPFEQYQCEKDNLDQVLERVGSLEQAEGIFDNWNKSYVPSVPLLGPDERHKLAEWYKEHAK